MRNKIHRIYVHISGGCYQTAENLPRECSIEVIDWDNLLGDGTTHDSWDQLGKAAKQHVQRSYPSEYRKILEARSKG